MDKPKFETPEQYLPKQPKVETPEQNLPKNNSKD